MKTKRKPPQLELPGTSDAFNLAVEMTEDGERIRRELETAKNSQLLAKALEEKQQRVLL